MLLAIDIGNSNICSAAWHNEQWTSIQRVSTKNENMLALFTASLDTLLSQISNNTDSSISTVVISSVVPNITEQLVSVIQQSIDSPILYVDTTLCHPLSGDIPKELGQDLFANAIASHVKSNPSLLLGTTTHNTDMCASLTVDLGTALTFIAVTSKGTIAGVAITPGIYTAFNTLTANTSLINNITLQAPKSVLGTNTNEAINSGIVMGYTHLIQGMVLEITQELQEPTRVFLTGGLVQFLQEYNMPLDKKLECDISVYHTLDGLRIFAEYNNN